MKPQTVVLFGALGLIIGALLPWASITSVFGTLSVSGLSGDGIISGALGVVLLLVALLRHGKQGGRFSVGASIVALLAGLVMWSVATSVSSVVSSTNTSESIMATTGPGVYLSLVGAVVAFVGGLQRTPNVAHTPA